MRHRYPFDALHWLRHKRVDEQATVVSESAARTARAVREEARAAAARRAAALAMSEVAGTEQALLDEGQLRAGDLQVVGDWRKGADATLQAKADNEQRAREASAVEATREAAARRALGTASNEAKMIETHRATFQAELEAARERTEEEAATEQWTAARFPARRS